MFWSSKKKRKPNSRFLMFRLLKFFGISSPLLVALGWFGIRVPGYDGREAGLSEAEQLARIVGGVRRVLQPSTPTPTEALDPSLMQGPPLGPTGNSASGKTSNPEGVVAWARNFYRKLPSAQPPATPNSREAVDSYLMQGPPFADIKVTATSPTRDGNRSAFVESFYDKPPPLVRSTETRDNREPPRFDEQNKANTRREDSNRNDGKREVARQPGRDDEPPSLQPPVRR